MQKVIRGFVLFLSIFVLSQSAFAMSFRILVIKNDDSLFARQFFAGFSASTPEKIIAFQYDGQNGRLLSKKIKEINPDLVLTIGDVPVVNAVSDFPSIPFILTDVHVASLANRSNVIRVDHRISIAERISILPFLLPDVKTIGTLYDPTYSKEEFDDFAKQASNLGLKILSIKVNSAKDVPAYIQGFKDKIDAYYFIADPTTLDASAQDGLYTFLQSHNVPSLSDHFVTKNQSALVSLYPDPLALGKKSWQQAHTILQEGKMNQKTIPLSPEDYVLSISFGQLKQHQIDAKLFYAFIDQAIQKEWKTYIHP
jgi:ABC-type uncharacterized transport system substrate-binding protein